VTSLARLPDPDAPHGPLAPQAALRAVLEAAAADLIVSTCGYPSRDLQAIGDRREHFYLVGSMGMAAPVALGVALAHPDRRIVAVDGDGSVAMNLGCLPMVAASGAQLVHVVLDNGLHESTGGQATVRPLDLPALALAAGYRSARTVDSLDELAALTFDATPALVHIPCAPRTEAIGARIRLTPAQLVARAREALDVPHSEEIE
jgi:phosphonopyruvate decarboxylase